MIYNFKTYSKYETTPSDEPEYLDRLRKVALKFVSQSSIHALLHKVFFGGGFDLIDKPLDDNNLSLFFALKNFVEPAINNAGLELLEKWFVIETEFEEKNGYAIQLTLINE